MKLLQVVLLFALVSPMSFAHADEKLDALINKCEEDSEEFYEAEQDWLDAVQDYKDCTKKSRNCSKEEKDEAYAKRNKLMEKYNADKPACNAARKQKEDEEKGLSGK